MKEHVEVINESFVDYAGKTHYFTIAAVSSPLPRFTGQMVNSPTSDEGLRVIHEVGIYVEDYGTDDYLCNVTKVVRLGISMCNPTDEYDEKVGALKAIARARANEPAILSVDPGTINTKVVRALLEQEAEYLKHNPENFIEGYADMKARFLKRQEMETMAENFSDLEKAVIAGVQENPKFLDNAFEYLSWVKNQNKGKCQD